MAYRHKTESERRSNAGRPSKFKKKYIKEIIELGAEGLFMVEIANQWGVGTSTLSDWCESYPEFSEAYSLAKEASQAYYSKLLREQSLTNFNALKYTLNVEHGIQENTTPVTLNVNTSKARDGLSNISPQRVAILRKQLLGV